MSVATQTYPNVEIVVVDDCSTDDSRDIVNQLARQYSNLKRIYLEKNGGVSHARNVGAKEASGEYLEFLDADDFFYVENKLANEMALVLKYLARGQKVMTYSCVACVNEDGKFVQHRGLDDQLEGHIVEAYLARYKKDRHSRNELIDREAFFLLGGFDETMAYWEDSDFFVRLLFIRPLYCTHKLGTAYRWRQGGLSRTSNISSLTVQDAIAKKYQKKFTKLQLLRFYWFKMRCFFRIFRLETYPRMKHLGSIYKHHLLRKMGIIK